MVCLYAGAQVGPEGALALADALKVNPVLSSLDVSNTRIGKQAARVLPQRGLRQHQLALASNRLSQWLPGSYQRVLS